MTRPRDTSEEAQRRQIAALRAMTPAQRVAAAAEMTDAVHRLLVAGVRSRHPEFGESEVAAAVAEILLGSELADRVRLAVREAAR